MTVVATCSFALDYPSTRISLRALPPKRIPLESNTRSNQQRKRRVKMPLHMELQSEELSIDDILSLHRHWITKLYVEDRKSEEEIVDALYERRLPVTCVPSCPIPFSTYTNISPRISQIQRCLREWNLRATSPSACSSSSASTSTSTTQSSSSDWEVLNRAPSPASSIHSLDPLNVESYSKRPLPELPLGSKSSSSSLRGKEKKGGGDERRVDRPKKDFLKVTCHGRESRPYEVEMTLGVVPKGPSPLQMYALDQQSHERLAIGLDRVPSLRRC